MADHQPTQDPTSVYRYYDKFDLLLYVGITRRGAVRNAEHYSTKTWWQYVTRQEVEHFSTRKEAASREVNLIREFRPPFNTQHNPGSAELRDAYLSIRQVGTTPLRAAYRASGLGRNRIPLSIHRGGHDITYLKSDHIPQGLRVGPKFPVSGAKLAWLTLDEGCLLAVVRTKRAAEAATLMYRKEPDGSLTIKRIDVALTEECRNAS